MNVLLGRRCAVATVALTLGALLAWPGAASALAPGSLDPSFGTGGRVLAQLGASPYPLSAATAVAVQRNGKLVLAADASDPSGSRQLLVARLNADGSFDSSFGSGGKVLVGSAGNPIGGSPLISKVALAVQGDGKLVVAGDDEASGGLVVRLNPDGSFDSSFGAGGKVMMPGEAAIALAVQGDGKLVVAGEGFAANASGPNAELLVARLNANGSFDSSFGTGGRVLAQLGAGASPDSAANAVAVQGDGKLVVAGDAFNIGVDSPYNQELLVARLNGNGSLDSSFGTGGRLLPQLGAGSDAFALAVQGDGKLALAGCASFGGLVARLNPDGSFDTSFARAGKLQVGDCAQALVLQRDGRLVLAATSGGVGLVARLNPEGNFDSSFGAGGLVAGAGEVPEALALQDDGKLVLAGSASVPGGGTELLVARVIGELPPTISQATLTHRRFRVAGGATAISARRRAPVGTSLRFMLSAPAMVTIAIVRTVAGVRHGGRCVVTRRERRRGHPERCARTLAVGTLTRAHEPQGPDRLAFSGRIGNRPLSPGAYDAILSATNPSGSSGAVKVAFAVVRSSLTWPRVASASRRRSSRSG